MLRKILLSTLLLVAAIAQAGEAGRVIFVAGEASVANRVATVGGVVQEGDRLATGADGYLYIKTVDNGFFIMRPGSAGRIATYRVDDRKPAETAFRLEVQTGVIRHISGEAVKAARHNFRLNTPVAAIGVRGTDFTVFTNQETSRVAVLSGGVIVSPFAEGCSVEGSGPCEGPASRELFASQVGQVLQINRGQAMPQLQQGSSYSPDAVAPPRSDEPAGASKRAGMNGASATPVGADLSLAPVKATVVEQGQSALVSTPPQLIWGRWQPLLGQAPEIDIYAQRDVYQPLAVNGYYALMRSREGVWQRPEQNTMTFALKGAQAVILDEPSRQLAAASVENGKLQLDFAKSTFSTQIDVVSQAERFKLQSYGSISRDGLLEGNPQFLLPTNMAVTGAMSQDNSSAAYLFQSRLDSRRVASGAAYWGK